MRKTVRTGQHNISVFAAHDGAAKTLTSKRKKMKKFITTLVIAAGFGLHAGAQSFLNDLQKDVQGEGTVTVKQSAEIDNLVNNAKLKSSQQQAQQSAQQQSTTAPAKPVSQKQDDTTARHDPHSGTPAHKPDSTDKYRNKAAEQETAEPQEVDTSKKVMRNSYKTTGYRIQAFSGGNTRADREKANKVGNAIKMKYPDQPIYVHFYSPRWICRVGNFRSYSEAAQMLKGIKAMGYTQACIVKGKINVAY